MASTDNEFNFKIKVRTYVLVSRPSRWGQGGGRVVVQSPMLNISKFDTRVPVRRFDGEGENWVDFLPRRDIEKDASNVYDKECVSRNPSWVNAHGIAITNSSDEKFEYKAGHRFWIYIGASPSQHKTTVPVINLDTFAEGHVDIEHVCWVPKYQGPASEFYTLGGRARKLKQGYSRNFSTWSWVICQQLSGPTTTKNLEILKSDGPLSSLVELSGISRRTLFEAKLKAMVEEYSKASVESLLSSSIANSLTPPSFPNVDDAALLGSSETIRPTDIAVSIPAQAAPMILPQTVPVAQITEPIFGERTQAKIFDFPMSNARSQAQIPPPQGAQGRTLMSIRRIIEQDVLSLEQNMVSCANDSVAVPSQMTGLPLCRVSQKRLHGDRSPMTNVSEAASTLIDLSPRFASQKYSISGKRQLKAAQRPSVHLLITGCTSPAGLCDRADAECYYLMKFTFKHFHSSGDTCQLSHVDHCISQLQTHPENLRTCLLSDLQSEWRHQCCHQRTHEDYLSQKRTFVKVEEYAVFPYTKIPDFQGGERRRDML